jgi:hypothetical protein
LKTSFTSILKYLFLLFISVALLLFAFKGQDFEKLIADLKTADYTWVVISSIACLIAHLLRAFRWQMLINTLGYAPVSVKNSFSAVMIGYLANLALPRMGEITRCGVINKTSRIPVNKLIGTVVAERLTDVLMLFIVIVLAISLQFDLIYPFLDLHVFSALNSNLLNWKNIGVLILLMAVAMIIYRYLKSKANFKIRSKIQELISGFSNGLRSVFSHNNQGVYIMYSILIWAFYYLSTYLCLFSLGATSHLGLSSALSVLVFGSLGMIVPVQGGIGAFHFMVAEGLTLYAVNKSDGLAFATILHSSQTLVILIIGGISLISLLLSPKKISNESIGSNK